MKIMEVCGTHTMAIARYGLRDFFKGAELISGPGCPVCVTPAERLEQCVSLSKKKNIIITSFGDILRVPAVSSSLYKMMSAGADIRIVYSVYEPLKIALDNPDKEVVFLGAGFETTAPLCAFVVKEAYAKKIKNFSVLSMFKSVFPAVALLCKDKTIKIDGFLLPGNVCAVTGFKDFEFIAKKHSLAAVVAGFSKNDIIKSVRALKKLIENKNFKIINEYPAAVSIDGNIKAKKILKEVFDLKDDIWRGFGKIKNSGFRLSKKYADFDADKKFKLKSVKAVKEKCLCGQIMKGVKTPRDCSLFAKKCVPQNPVGPCMVSSEGVCAAYYKYK